MASDENARSYWILELVVRVFGALERLIPQKVLCRDLTDDATDKWVLGNMLLSMTCFVFYSVLHRLIRFFVRPAPLAAAMGLIVTCPILLYAAWRIFGIVIYQFNTLVVHPVQSEKAGKPYCIESCERRLVLTLLNYVTIVFWFALFYRTLYFLFRSPREIATLFGSLYASLATMSLLGAHNLEPTWAPGYGLLAMQVAIALFMTLVVVAQAVGGIQHHAGEWKWPGLSTDSPLPK